MEDDGLIQPISMGDDGGHTPLLSMVDFLTTTIEVAVVRNFQFLDFRTPASRLCGYDDRYTTAK